MSRVLFDTFQSIINESAFEMGATDQKDFYGEVKEQFPLGILELLINSAHMTYFFNAYHAVNVATQRLHTGVLIYVINVPIIWFSKNQNTVQSSMFGYEFVAMWITRDLIILLCYKLRMFGVPLDGPYDVRCDNQ